MFGDPRLPSRFWTKVRVDGAGCWNWTGALSVGGYGRIRMASGRPTHRVAHRFAYESLIGAVADGLQLDHLCRNRACANPAHMEPVTPRENTRRSESFTAKNMIKTHCTSGHAFDAENTRIGADGSRVCRACVRQRMRDLRAADGKVRTPRPWARVSP